MTDSAGYVTDEAVQAACEVFNRWFDLTPIHEQTVIPAALTAAAPFIRAEVLREQSEREAVQARIDPGSFCEDCGHFAARHDETGCRFPDRDCACDAMRWQGHLIAQPWVTGKTAGGSSGPHLHQEFRRNGERVEPVLVSIRPKGFRVSSDAEAAVERVRALHQPDPEFPKCCGGCWDHDGMEIWPCPTIRALDGGDVS